MSYTLQRRLCVVRLLKRVRLNSRDVHGEGMSGGNDDGDGKEFVRLIARTRCRRRDAVDGRWGYLACLHHWCHNCLD